MKANKKTGKIEFTPTEMHEYNNKIGEEVQKHTLPSPETKKLIKTLMENQRLVVTMLEDFKTDFKSFKEENKEAHVEIIKRQDHTNGSINKLKKNQLILRTVLGTVFIVMAVLGFMPERVYQMLKGII